MSMRNLTATERAILAYVVSDPDVWWQHASDNQKIDAESALSAKIERWRPRYEANRPLKRRVVMLYTDQQGTEATKQDALDYIASLDAAADAEATAARQAAADEVQAWLDAHAVFSDKGITVSPDEVDAGAVHLTFPTDQSAPVFWAAAAKEIVQTHGGEYVTAPYTVRVRKGEQGATAGANAYAHLARISEAFPA